jgi:hypothetical protein
MQINQSVDQTYFAIHYRFILVPTDQGICLTFAIESELFEQQRIPLITISGGALNDATIEPDSMKIVIYRDKIIIHILSGGISYANFKNKQPTYLKDEVNCEINFKTSSKLKHILSCGPNINILQISNIKFVSNNSSFSPTTIPFTVEI